MNQITPNFWLSLVQFAWLIAVTLALWLRKPGEEAHNRLSGLADRVTRQDQLNATAVAELRARNELLEERIKHLPTHNDIRALMSDVSALKGDVSSIRAGQNTQQQSLNMIQEFLHKKG